MAGLRWPAPPVARGMRAPASSMSWASQPGRKVGPHHPPLPCLSAQASPRSRGVGEVLDACLARSLQRTPSSPHRGLADGGATVGQTPEQLALFPTGSLVLLGLLAVQLLRTLDTSFFHEEIDAALFEGVTGRDHLEFP